MCTGERLPRARRPHGRAPACCRGLSLLEVLVAFAILAIALGVLLRIFGTGLRGAATADAYSRAVLRAESLLAQTGSESALKPGEEHGVSDDGYEWRRFVRPYRWDPALDPSTQMLAAYQVDLEVSWAEGGKRHAFTLTTLRVAPRQQRGRILPP